MEEGGSAPPRATGARQAVRYGLRWHARDALQSARHWLARASVTEVLGAFWVVAGAVLLIVALAIGPRTWMAIAPGLLMCCAGALMAGAARHWGWRR